MHELQDLDTHVPDSLVEYWLSEHHNDPAYDAASGYPDIFARLYEDDGQCWEVTREDLAQHVGAAWQWWGMRDRCVDRAAWRTLFDLAGYREDDEPALHPVEPLTLWRGATPEHHANWSWTDVRDEAHMYTSGRYVQDEVGLIWRAVVEPGRLLAKINWGRYCEYVVDTDGLLIEPDGLWCRCPVDLDPFRGSDRDARVALDTHEVITCPRL